MKKIIIWLFIILILIQVVYTTNYIGKLLLISVSVSSVPNSAVNRQDSGFSDSNELGNAKSDVEIQSKKSGKSSSHDSDIISIDDSSNVPGDSKNIVESELITGLAVEHDLKLPPTYHQFYGTVKYSHGPDAIDGTLVIAEVNSINFSAVVSNGKYGYSPLFLVENANDADLIEFFVNDNKEAEYTFEDGAATQLNLIIPGFVDLQPTEITYYSYAEPIKAGMWIVFESGIKNTGVQDAEDSFNIRWFLDDEEVRYGSHVPIDAGQTIMDDNSAYVWNPAMPGIHTIKFVVNADLKHVNESDYSNNEIEIQIDIPENCKYFYTPGCDYIDLKAGEITYSGVNPITFSSSMSNIGSLDSAAFNIKWFVDGNQVVYRSNSAIAAGATVENVATSHKWDNPTSGQHTIKFAVNVDKHFAELNYDNNEASITVNVP